MNILCIGNSFSQDACRYLHGIARADGTPLDTVNLYVGGCSLQMHHRYMVEDACAYELQYNGQNTGFPLSLKQALKNRTWDVITLQQVSQDSPHFETFEPYLCELAATIRSLAPDTPLVMHQTWAYEQGSARLREVARYDSAEDMLADVRSAYGMAAEHIGACGIIPSGELLAMLIRNGIPRVHRDTFHASLGLGRYALGLLWYRMLCNVSVEHNTFSDFDETIPPEEIQIAKHCVDRFAPLFPINTPHLTESEPNA